MNITIKGHTYHVQTEADLIRLLYALQTLAALARGKAA